MIDRDAQVLLLAPADALAFAYAVVSNADGPTEALWWAIVWPCVQRVEAQMRAGRTPRDVDRRALLIAAFEFLRWRCSP